MCTYATFYSKNQIIPDLHIIIWLFECSRMPSAWPTILTRHLNNIKHVPVRLNECNFLQKEDTGNSVKNDISRNDGWPPHFNKLGGVPQPDSKELLQGSAASGMFAPKGSVLLTSNDEEVKRCGM